MGLATSHDCWYGGYGGFMLFRARLAAAIGFDITKMDWFTQDGIPWPSIADEPLVSLLAHSDCDGEIPVEELLPLADVRLVLADAEEIEDHAAVNLLREQEMAALCSLAGSLMDQAGWDHTVNNASKIAYLWWLTDARDFRVEPGSYEQAATIDATITRRVCISEQKGNCGDRMSFTRDRYNSIYVYIQPWNYSEVYPEVFIVPTPVE